MYSSDNIIANGRFSGRVQRYHAWPMCSTQTVGEHCWQMWRIYNEIWGLPSAEAAGLIMCHDSGELSTGDMPLYAKRDIPELKRVMDEAERVGQRRVGMVEPKTDTLTQWRVKMCDMLEGMEHAMMDASMGNKYAILVQHNYVDAIMKYCAEKDVDYHEINRVQTWLNNLFRDHTRLNAVEVQEI